MKKTITTLIFLCVLVSGAFGQPKPRLGILPFSGGADEDGETIATLFSNQEDIKRAFEVVPRTSAVNALVAEQNFQMSGYTDSDTVARLGRMLNADFVVSGHIRRLGNRNLVITTIINVETFELLAGDYREYREIRPQLPSIANKMIAASKRNTVSLPTLAVAPFRIATQGANAQDGETLAQILAVEVANTGKYAVLPRTTTMQDALKEQRFQTSGYTAEEDAKRLGAAINAEYVLSAQLRSLEGANMFIGQILNVENGSQKAGDSLDYLTISDGIVLMKELALLLIEDPGAQKRKAAGERELARAAFFGNPARLWSVGVSVGSAVADPLLIGTIRATIAPLRYSFLELGGDFGFISNKEGVTSYYSIFPFAHYALFLPFAGSGGWYLGAGGSYMIAEHRFDDISMPRSVFAADITTGFNLGNFLDISYTLRTNFASASNKISVGYCYRFR